MDISLDTVYNAVLSILMASPTILVALVGGVLVLLRRQRHPKASMLALAGLLIYLAISLFFPVLYAVLPALLTGGAWSVSSYSILYRGLSFFHHLAEAVALALLLAAVFAGRGAQPNTSERNLA